MFNFIYQNTIIIDEFIYIICGLICLLAGIKGLSNKNAPIGTFLFWTLLGFLFSCGKFIIDKFQYGGAFIGAILMVIAIITVSNNVKMGNFKEQSQEQKIKYAKIAGNKIFIPALAMGIIAMIMAQFKSFKIVVDSAKDGSEIFFGFSAAQVLGITSVIAIILAIAITHAKFKETREDTAKMLMQIGSSSLLPQLLGALGGIFATAGVGDIIGAGMSAIVPAESKVFGVIAYCIGMVLFTMIMGNAFAAFTVMTIGVAVPFVIGNGGDPAIVASLGMTCGFCGTLMTPMAANFNIVPAAILECENEKSIMKIQTPVALALIVVHIILMLVLAF
ncbi:DUF979 domain-containing protein [Anaerococcus porci]|uniref:DUF979 domain-containing protein n=1 Tax=Anaerococcus porci TaxID=2652269 RepID=UPI002A764CF2|nr:DUF979 domain-containing protein [Anaerococcus porci]MDY3006489.1 DUF979 domain-containing protein [Anaerococcus porci]